MTERKPPEISFASWIDQRINEAAERGAFDNLPGAGKPLPRRGEAGDGQAWLRDYLRREGVAAEELLPTPLRLRKEVERLTGTVQDLRSEQEVREVVAGLNRRILAWRRIPEGPPVYLPLVNEETTVARWRDARHPGAQPGAACPAQAPRPETCHPRAADGGIASAAGEYEASGGSRHPSHVVHGHQAEPGPRCCAKSLPRIAAREITPEASAMMAATRRM